MTRNCELRIPNFGLGIADWEYLVLVELAFNPQFEIRNPQFDYARFLTIRKPSSPLV